MQGESICVSKEAVAGVVYGVVYHRDRRDYGVYIYERTDRGETGA